MSNRIRCFGFFSRLHFFVAITAFAFLIFASPSKAAASGLDKLDADISENIFAIELAPVVDYGIFPERLNNTRKPVSTYGVFATQTPPAEDGAEESDPKPMKPAERPGIPVDPAYLDQPLACTAPIVNASATSGNEDETFAVVNPTNSQQIVVFSNLATNSIHRSYTTNGGSSWTHGTVATNVACCDAQAAWDNFGNLFLVYISANSPFQINVILSTNGGASFGSPTTLATGNQADQPVIAVGSNTVWVAWDTGSAMAARGAPVTGLGTVGAWVAQEAIPSSSGGDYAGIAVGPSGKVIVTYTTPTGGQGPATIYENVDADGLGAGGFGARVTVTTTNVGGFDYIPAQSSRSIDSEPGVVWDATGGPFNNRIYMVYTEEPVNESSDTEIYMRISDNDGATWTAPVRVNDDATMNSQFLPYVALDPTTGTVAVGFYDSRNDNGTVGAGGTNTTPNDDAEYWATYSTNGGVTWAPNVRLSGGWSNAAAAGAAVDYGDYMGQSAYGGKFYAIWADNSNCDGTNPNGTLHQFDLVMGILNLPTGGTPTPTLTPTNTPTFTPTLTPTRTSTSTPTSTATATFTPTLTPTKTPTFTPTNTATSTATNTATATNTPTNSATNTPTGTPTPTPLNVALPVVTAAPGSSITIPITVGDTTGQSIYSYDLQITYDPTVVQPDATPYDTTGTISSTMSITPNTSNSGHFIISAFQADFISGAGTLINLKFTAVGSTGQSTNLTFEDYTDPGSTFHPGFEFGEGTPAVGLTNGSITLFASMITGTVTYGNALGSPTPRFVSNVTISGMGSPNVMTTTGAPGSGAGQYTLSGFGSGSYTVTPTKIGGSNGAINSFDAARIAQHVAGLNLLTGNQLIVADVSNNGTISSFDAGEIANFVVSGPNTGTTGTWRFNPVNRMYASVTTNISGEDYLALLMGEVSGNWLNTGARPVAENNSGETILVSAPHLVTPGYKEVIVPVNVEGIAGKDIIAYEFDLRYDPAIIQPQANAVDVAGTVSGGLTAVAKADESGLLRVAVYGPMPVDGDGLLLNLKFTVVGPPGCASSLVWDRIMFNEGDTPAIGTDGSVELLAAAANETAVAKP